MGPVSSQAQYDKIQALIESGIAQGAKLVTGGLGRPTGLERGYYVKPTVFADVRPGMRIAREEIFGPVLSILPYETPEQAIALAEDTRYGLATYIQTRDLDRARKIARQVRTGNVYINYPAWDVGVAFGGYKRSGNGRECAEFGLDDYLEIKGILGYEAI
jgi:aldehyde dehydrogenase (NAD+)